MDDFKKLTEQLLKIYINAESVNDVGLENYFDENISIIGTGKHEIYKNLHEFLESFKFDVKQRGKIRIEPRNLCQKEEQLDDKHALVHGMVDFVGLFENCVPHSRYFSDELGALIFLIKKPEQTFTFCVAYGIIEI